MAGKGSRFASANFHDPKPLINIMGKPMISWVIDNLRPNIPHRFIFICLAEHLHQYPEIRSNLRLIAPNCEIIEINEVTQGAACTVLLANEFINNNDQLMIANSDQIVSLDINEYLTKMDDPSVDGLIMTFWSDDPKWSFCKIDQNGTVEEVVEKEVVSNDATVGIYNFRKGLDFVHAANEMIAKNLRVNNEFYVAPSYNQLINKGKKIVIKSTGKEYEGMHGLGIPQDLAHFMTTDLFFTKYHQPGKSLINLTNCYIEHFQNKNIDAIGELMVNEFVLKDPNGVFSGKVGALRYLEGLFVSSNKISFEPISVRYLEPNSTLIEFKLRIDEIIFEGVDLISWKDQRMNFLTAYLNRIIV